MSPRRAARRLAARNTLTAGVVAGLISAMLVTAGTAVIAVLWWGAHLVSGCTAQASISTDCGASGANGYITNWTAVLWSVQGSGEFLGTTSGTGVPLRLPLGLGIGLFAAALFLGGRVTVRTLFLRSPGDAMVRAVVLAVTYTGAMACVGAAMTARSPGFALGPDYPMLAAWGLVVGVMSAYCGILRSTFPSAPASAFAQRARRRLGPLGPYLSAALAGLLVASALAVVAGVVAMATHPGDTAVASRAVVTLTSTKPFPDGILGTLATIVLLVLAAPTWATWVLAYSLIIPTVSVGGADYGLTSGEHDAYLWVVVLVPILATLFTGFAGARLRRAGTVETAAGTGALAGVLWGLLAWLAVVLLDGNQGVIGSPGGTTIAFGPSQPTSLLALLLWGGALGALGGYLSLLTVARRSRLPLLRRYSATVVGVPLVPFTSNCPMCSLPVARQAESCPRCGRGLAATSRGFVVTATPPGPPESTEVRLYGPQLAAPHATGPAPGDAPVASTEPGSPAAAPPASPAGPPST